MQAEPDFDRLGSDVAIWHGYDLAVKAEVYATCLITRVGSYFIDPIPLHSEALDELGHSGRLAGIIVINCDLHRSSTKLVRKSSVRSSRTVRHSMRTSPVR